jgi:hypothetical protein
MRNRVDRDGEVLDVASPDRFGVAGTEYAVGVDWNAPVLSGTGSSA